MKVSDFLTALERHNYNASVVVSNANNLFSIESIVKDKDDAVVLMARPVPSIEGCVGTVIDRDSMLAKALLQGVFASFQGELIPSVQNPGKFQAEIDSVTLPEEFDTENDAMNFLRGFTLGLSVGGGIKNMAEGLPSRLKQTAGLGDAVKKVYRERIS
jgi:hypothetical protein